MEFAACFSFASVNVFVYSSYYRNLLMPSSTSSQALAAICISIWLRKAIPIL